MAICGCDLPARCCQPAVAGSIIYADLWGELNTHLAPQVLFTQSSPVLKPLLQAFPFPRTLGEVTLHPLSLSCVFIYNSRGKWVFHPSPVGFSSHRSFYKLSCSWLLGVGHHSCLLQLACLFTVHMGGGSSPLSCGVFLPLPLSQDFLLLVAGQVPWLPPSLARPGLFIYSTGKDSPPPLFGAQCTPPSLPLVFIVLIAYYSVSLFPPVWGQSVQGAMLIWPRDSVEVPHTT
jgi:hypothetical protein